MLSHVLTETYWTALSPAMPKDFAAPGKTEAKRMSEWLITHQRNLDPSLCESILQIAFINFASNWIYKDDLHELKNQIAPLFSRFGINDSAESAWILIDPDKQTIDTDFDVNIGHPHIVFGRIYALEIPGDISGKVLVDILVDPEFLSLVKLIENNWQLEWNGSNHIGRLDETTLEKLEEFRHFIDSTDPESGYIILARDYLEPIFSVDEDGSQEINQEIDDAKEISVMDSHTITPETDVHSLFLKIRSNVDDDILLINLEEELNELYNIVCENTV